MNYKFSRKINLSNIDKELYPYEMEDIGVDGADSFEEAVKEVDKFVAERIGYYRAMSNIKKAEPAPTPVPTPAPTTPPPSTTPAPTSTPAPAPVPAPTPVSTAPYNRGDESNKPPAEFEI